MKKVQLSILLLFIAVGFLFAQTIDPYTSKMDSIFQHVDKSKITTGLLSS